MLSGIYGLLVAALVTRGSRDIVFACVGLLCMAAWRRSHPARNQGQWMLGALVALVMVGWVYADPRSGGSSGPFLYLLVLMAMAYPLLLDASRVWLFATCLLVVYGLAGWNKNPAVSPELFVLRGVLIAGICMVSARFGMVLRQAEHAVEALRHDKASLAYNEHGLARYGARLLNTCHQENQPCTLVLLTMPQEWYAPVHLGGHSSEYSATHSPKVQIEALRDMVHNLAAVLPHDALVTRSQQGDWVLLVPWLDRPAAINVLESAFGRPLQLPFGPRNEEMFVVLTPCAVASTGRSDSVEQMLSRAHDIWQRGVRTGAVDAND
jgi:hypothetical protein